MGGSGRVPESVLRLPGLELRCPDAQRGYRHAIDEFVEWYCSEPRLSFSKAVVVRYRMHLESRGLVPGTINLRLGAVRRLAYEAADCGLLSADLAAGVDNGDKIGRAAPTAFQMAHTALQSITFNTTHRRRRIDPVSSPAEVAKPSSGLRRIS